MIAAEQKRRLEEARSADLPVCSPGDVWDPAPRVEDGIEEGSREWVVATNDLLAIEEYLRGFLPPGSPCPCCGLTTVFYVWTFVHGIAKCGECGWPITVYHFVKRDDEDICRFNLALFAHPSTVTTREERDDRRDRD